MKVRRAVGTNAIDVNITRRSHGTQIGFRAENRVVQNLTLTRW
jgi:hypothetical protein